MPVGVGYMELEGAPDIVLCQAVGGPGRPGDSIMICGPVKAYIRGQRISSPLVAEGCVSLQLGSVEV